MPADHISICAEHMTSTQVLGLQQSSKHVPHAASPTTMHPKHVEGWYTCKALQRQGKVGMLHCALARLVHTRSPPVWGWEHVPCTVQLPVASHVAVISPLPVLHVPLHTVLATELLPQSKLPPAGASGLPVHTAKRTPTQAQNSGIVIGRYSHAPCFPATQHLHPPALQLLRTPLDMHAQGSRQCRSWPHLTPFVMFTHKHKAQHAAPKPAGSAYCSTHPNLQHAHKHHARKTSICMVTCRITRDATPAYPTCWQLGACALHRPVACRLAFSCDWPSTGAASAVAH
jgi:hypothetical protein